MKRSITLALFTIFGLVAYGSNIKSVGIIAQKAFDGTPTESGIKFPHSTWKAAMECSKKEDKIIFLDCYTSWCGPCKWMAKNTFTHSKVGEYFNKKFINMKLDMEKTKEGVRLGEKFNVGAYPTLLFIDKNEKLVRRSVGALKWSELLALGKEVGG